MPVKGDRSEDAAGNFCVWRTERTGMRMCCRFCVAGPCEAVVWHAVSKFGGAKTIRTTVEDNERSKAKANCEKLQRYS